MRSGAAYDRSLPTIEGLNLEPQTIDETRPQRVRRGVFGSASLVAVIGGLFAASAVAAGVLWVLLQIAMFLITGRWV